MTTWALSIEAAAADALAEQHDALLAVVRPFLQSLPRRRAGRVGNVLSCELLSARGIRETNRYLVLIDVDLPSPRALRRLAGELTEVLPVGSTVSVLGEFESAARSPESQVMAW
ncbi:laccase-1 [Mycolicibacterium canariasense]|uniref:Laccase-1 n=1 Tax=Mycolicibacterium canariasense TaxID=228230 RepID=A0A100WBM9_MYCCR|nr:hypothetical protein [Mycolicibacterium canariasense]MCV7209256.1 hypothetical protein [Mycolicibacterium canariasense]ORV05906.1 hypothetical protein AWB94_18550 [Mycolicibacterium canariasense]GAS95216.1 laccase-1 [Mycolicibacterium canariasense]